MRRYLIVDDNRAFAENLAEILRDEGAEVTTASGGAEAIQLAERTRFDALLTDMRMPVMGGAAVVHAIRAVDPGLPALVMTAYIQDSELDDARREGLLCVLPKPVPLKTVSSLLEGARRDGLVAVIEDDAALADNVSEILRSRGLAAVTAASVLETERLGPVRPFAAVVDLRVPGGPDGEALKRLSSKYPGIPVIVITAHSEIPPPVPVRAFFSKPFDPKRLLEVLEQVHAQRRP